MRNILIFLLLVVLIFFTRYCDSCCGYWGTCKTNDTVIKDTVRGVAYHSHQLVTYVKDTEIEKRLDSLGFKKIDSCACESGFSLWQSENTTAVEGIGVIADAGGKAEGVGTGTDIALRGGLGVVGFNLVLRFSPRPIGNGNNATNQDRYRIDTVKIKSFKQPQGPTVRTVKVAIVDTGVDSTFAGLNTLPTGMPIPNGCTNYPQVSPLGLDMVNPLMPPQDKNGHGTRINGILADLSRASSSHTNQSENTYANVRLEVINAKFTADTTTSGSLFDAICGIYYAINQEAQVINLSWGFQSDSLPYAFLPVLKKAQDKDILIVAGAGNDSVNIDQAPSFWPAAFASDAILYFNSTTDTIQNVISVGAYKPNNTQLPPLADFSNYGLTNVNLLALGVDVYSPDIIGDTGNPKTQISLASGTSFAAPFITRLAALMRGDKPSASAKAIKYCITTNSKPNSTLINGIARDFRFRLNGTVLSACP